MKVIACAVLFREVSLLAARSRNVIDTSFMPAGLHGIETGEMTRRLQKEVDATDPKIFDSVCLAYGLCNNGTEGLQAKDIPLVIPRAHDCITFFLGSKERYQKEFESCPGTYYRTSGWIERDFTAIDGRISERLGLNQSRQELVEKYGDELAEYIIEQTSGWKRSYSRLAFVDMGIADVQDYEREAVQEASEKGWRFQKLGGDLSLLRRLIEGQWDPDEFVVLQPGERLAASHDEKIFKAEHASRTPEV